MKLYKVWIHIEEVDEDKDLFLDVSIPCLAGDFITLEAAQELQDKILEIGVDQARGGTTNVQD